jgi:hypothetical protein
VWIKAPQSHFGKQTTHARKLPIEDALSPLFDN